MTWYSVSHILKQRILEKCLHFSFISILMNTTNMDEYQCFVESRIQTWIFSGCFTFHLGQTEILQEVQGLDSKRLTQNYFLWWGHLLTILNIWKIICRKICECYHESCFMQTVKHPEKIHVSFHPIEWAQPQFCPKTLIWTKNGTKMSCKRNFSRWSQCVQNLVMICAFSSKMKHHNTRQEW